MAEVSRGKGGIGAFLRNIPTFINQVKAETAKVYWPSWGETWKTAAMVAALTFFLGIFLFAIDWGFSRTVQFLLGLVQG